MQAAKLIGVVSERTDRYLDHMVKQVPAIPSSCLVEAADPGGEKPGEALAAGASYTRENPKTAIAAGAALAAGVITAAALPLVRGRSGTGEAKKAGGGKKTAVVTARGAAKVRSSKVKFGSVTVSGAKPGAAAIATSVKRSTDALERATKRLVKPGVVIRAKKDVPQFSAAENERGVFIRRLNGRVERGRLVDGTFQVID